MKKWDKEIGKDAKQLLYDITKKKKKMHHANSAESFSHILVIKDIPRKNGDIDFHLLSMKLYGSSTDKLWSTICILFQHSILS